MTDVISREAFLEAVKFNDDGLVPVIAQSCATGLSEASSIAISGAPRTSRRSASGSLSKTAEKPSSWR